MSTYIVHYLDREGVEHTSRPMTERACWKYEAALHTDGLVVTYVSQAS